MFLVKTEAKAKALAHKRGLAYNSSGFVGTPEELFVIGCKDIQIGGWYGKTNADIRH